MINVHQRQTGETDRRTDIALAIPFHACMHGAVTTLAVDVILLFARVSHNALDHLAYS